ncbi:SAM-dependent methyltransferase [Streptomyces beihaiensis]|uniref:Class I SAM-dependent methyltransferase n=1 Tax=Streptomyces beihaiensis TaxID=2984495 RepID=A0ABT3TW45_9ACTN|nr:class I SAM-dependent methyltransferase [Streptomyces beihaiensis]MCX3060280.1 class I SAM-dependent methyltransferase [Streptomyces beihaiensis]
MVDRLAPPRLTRLTFHGPLSEDRAARLIHRLTGTDTGTADPAARTTVLDIGCGWGEFMLRLLEATPGATGVGIDLAEDDLARGRANAERRGLAERVHFAHESAVDTTRGPADVVLCFSSSHALTDTEPPHHTAAALRALHRLVKPGGRVLLGEGFWQRPPLAAELSAMWPDASASEFHDLAGLVDLAIAEGFRPAWIESASLDEWEHFESAYQADVEEWLAAHPDHPLAKETRERVDRHRGMWLRGYRGVMGLAYLTLVPVEA